MREKEYINLLKELVKRRSLSGQEGKVDEDSVAGLVWEHLQEIGVEAAYQEVGTSHNVICEIGDGDRCIVFSAHMDTVSAGDSKKWFADPFSAAEGVVRYLGGRTVEVDVEGKKFRGVIREQLDRIWQMRDVKEKRIIYGRGSFDNKASVAILLFLIDFLKDKDLDGKVYFAFTVREEVDGAGIRKFINEYDFSTFKKRYAVVLEGSYSFTPVIAHKGVCWAYIRTHGKRSHASTPHLGRNAVTEMCKIVNHLEADREEIIDELYSYSSDELLGKPTFSVTSIVGGGVKKVENGRVERVDLNVIPDFCEVSIDIRFGRNITADQIREAFTKRIKEISDDFEFILEDDTFYPAAGIGGSIEDARNHELVRAAIESSGVRHLEIAPGATEGAFLHPAGFETLVEFGPAGAFSHDIHEYVEMDEIGRGVAVLSNLLANLGFLK